MSNLKSKTNNCALKLVNCNLSFGDKVIFKNLNLEVNLGDKLAILGKNGSGKTSLVESIINPKKNFTGEIIRDQNLHLSFVFQQMEFFGPIRVLFSMYAHLLDIPDKMDQWLKYFGMEYASERNFDYLSGGEKQKIKLMIAFLKKPDILIVDEISTSLDYITRIKIIDDIKRLLAEYPNITLIMISHDEHEITELCDQYVILKDGQLSAKQKFRTEKKLAHTIEVLESL